MDKRLCEISRFFVAPPRVIPLSVCARARESTYHFIQKYLQLSIYYIRLCVILLVSFPTEVLGLVAEILHTL